MVHALGQIIEELEIMQIAFVRERWKNEEEQEEGCDRGGLKGRDEEKL